MSSQEKRRPIQHRQERRTIWSLIQQAFRSLWDFLRCKWKSEPNHETKSDKKLIMHKPSSAFRPPSRQSEHFLGEEQVELLDVQRKSSFIPPLPEPGPEYVKLETIEESLDLVFFGKGGSGVTSTIWTLLNIISQENVSSNEEASINQYTVQLANTVSHKIVLRIHDFPGFIKGDNVQNDAELATAISTYMEKHMKNKVPDAVFITAKLSDNRFAGDSSNFKKMLVSLSHSRIHWGTGPDEHACLTLTDTRSVEPEVTPQKQAEYELTYREVFHDWKGRSAVIDNTQVVNSRNELIQRFEGMNQSLATALKKLKPNSVKNSLKVVKKELVSDLIPDSRREINEVLASLNDVIPFEIKRLADISPHRCTPWVSYGKSSQSQGNGSYFLSDMKVLMADRVLTLPIKELKRGDKLLDKSLRGYNVIDSIRSFSVHELKCPTGIKLCSQIDGTALKYNGRKLIEVDFEDAENHFSLAFIQSKSKDVSVIKFAGFGDRSTCIVDDFVVICG